MAAVKKTTKWIAGLIGASMDAVATAGIVVFSDPDILDHANWDRIALALGIVAVKGAFMWIKQHNFIEVFEDYEA